MIPEWCNKAIHPQSFVNTTRTISGIYVENLSEYVVRGPEEVHSLLQLGKKRLIFAETKMNRTSSRFVPWILRMFAHSIPLHVY